MVRAMTDVSCEEFTEMVKRELEVLPVVEELDESG